MMATLQERLRARWADGSANLEEEAATEIDQLEAEVERLKAVRDHLESVRNQISTELYQLKPEVFHLKAELAALRAQEPQLLMKRAERDALSPEAMQRVTKAIAERMREDAKARSEFPNAYLGSDAAPVQAQSVNAELVGALNAMLSYTAELNPNQGLDDKDNPAVKQACAALAKAKESRRG